VTDDLKLPKLPPLLCFSSKCKSQQSKYEAELLDTPCSLKPEFILRILAAKADDDPELIAMGNVCWNTVKHHGRCGSD